MYLVVYTVHTPAKLYALVVYLFVRRVYLVRCEACFLTVASKDAIKFTTFNILCKISFDPTLIHSQKRAVRFESVCTFFIAFHCLHFNFNISMIVKNFGAHFFLLSFSANCAKNTAQSHLSDHFINCVHTI